MYVAYLLGLGCKLCRLTFLGCFQQDLVQGMISSMLASITVHRCHRHQQGVSSYSYPDLANTRNNGLQP